MNAKQCVRQLCSATMGKAAPTAAGMKHKGCGRRMQRLGIIQRTCQDYNALYYLWFVRLTCSSDEACCVAEEAVPERDEHESGRKARHLNVCELSGLRKLLPELQWI